MSIQFFAYNNASELTDILHRIKADNLKYVIPSRKDKFFFPLRGSYRELWTWEEIYADITAAEGRSRKIVLSPPDHLLILSSILDKTAEEYCTKILREFEKFSQLNTFHQSFTIISQN